MPAISRGSSARSRRRQASEDNIEDGDPSQRSRTEDVEDADEEQPTARTSKANAKASSKKKQKSKRKRTEESEDADSDGEGSNETSALAIDIQNFQNKPLPKADARKISAVASDWEQIRRNLRTSTFPQAEQVAVAMAEAGESKDGEEVSCHSMLLVSITAEVVVERPSGISRRRTSSCASYLMFKQTSWRMKKRSPVSPTMSCSARTSYAARSF